MADTTLQVVVSPFLGVLFDNLSSLIHQEFHLIWGVPKEMEKLSTTLSIIQSVLKDAEKKQVTENEIRIWLRKLKSAAYDADDVLDECSFEGLEFESEMIRNTSCTKKVTESFLCCLNVKQTVLRRKIGTKIRKLNERFDAIAEERSKFHLNVGVLEARVEEPSPNRETSSFLAEPQVYGRDEDRENLVSLLLNNVNNQVNISVCPLVGIGGLGKTTLAQMVYRDERVAKHFEVMSWVCVSDDFNVKRLVKSILECISGSASDLEDLENLQRLLEDKLRGKRFLLVLDDVWNEDPDKWEKLISSFGFAAEGSSILVTTRSKKVATITGTVLPYDLEVLSENDCWLLFKQRAFGLGNEERPGLVDIGKEIVKKCGGVPLAAKALGGLLRFKSKENEWLFVKDSEVWDLPENNILQALKLSYNQLPSPLPQCFAFCSIFPKDYLIKRKELLELWIANGFVQSKGRMELEDVGNGIFTDLLWRSFFQDVTKDGYGNIETCKMHDLVHDLACSIMLNDCQSVDDGTIESIDKSTRHLLITQGDNFGKEIKLPPLPPLLRTFHTYPLGRVTLDINALQSSFSDLRCLRFLDLSCYEVCELPIQISHLKHLRYLNLSTAMITSLPEEICVLRNLQVLLLGCCEKLVSLPKNLSRMSSLRHLCITDCDELSSMPHRMGKLSHLRKLSNFKVGLNSGCHISELQALKLGGALCIERLELVRNWRDGREAKMKEKINLESLDFSWSSSCSQENAAEVIETLQPHPNLKKLCIKGYGGACFPRWLGVSSLLPKLVEVYLEDCRSVEDLPSLGQLPLLKVLHIEGMASLKSVGNEFYGEGEGTGKGFPSLKQLKLYNMPELEEWLTLVENGTEIPVFPVLEILNICFCPKLKTFPFPSCVQELTLVKCKEVVPRMLQNLPSVWTLRISEFDELVCFPDGILGNLFALRDLWIEECNKLQCLPVDLENLTALTNLTISNCKELSSIPEGLQNLTFFTISGCDGVKSLQFLKRCCSLTNLKISNCWELELLGDDFQRLISLERLQLRDLPKLRCLPWMGNLTSLRYLTIRNCENLELLGDGFQQLISLKRLQLWGLPKLRCLPWMGNLTSLRYLSIASCENLELLGDDFQQLISLERLQLWSLPKLRCLAWMGNLTSLRYLTIWNCENLELIPEEMQRLTALHRLEIRGCSDELGRRCEKEKGQDWHNISHIPNLLIN